MTGRQKKVSFNLVAPVHHTNLKHPSAEHHGLVKGGMPLLLETTKKRPEMEQIRTSRMPQVKRALLGKIVPTSLIPLSTANGMLVLGSHKTSGPYQDCSFLLPEYLIWAGTISTSLVVIGIAGRYILEWIIQDKVISKGEKNILLTLEYVGMALVMIEIAIIVSGALVIYPHLPKWQSHYKSLPNYCDYGMVVFSSVFIGLALFIILIALILAVVLVFCDKDEKRSNPVDV